MAVEIVMPKLSDTMEEGRIIKWLKKVGDHVKEGEPLLEVETDKADIEVESFDTGVLIEIIAEEGETVPVGEKIGMIGAEEEAKEAGKPLKKKPPKEEVEEEEEEAEEEEEQAKTKEKAEAEKERERAEKERIRKAEEKKREEEERKKEETRKKREEEERRKPKEPREERRKPSEEERKPRPDVEVHMEARQAIERFVARRAPAKVSASPLARELAQKHGIDLSGIKGTGPDGEIVKRDVEKIVAQKEKRPTKEEAKPPTEAIRATPLAVVLAEKEGVDLEEVKGTGINGRIRESDVKAYVARRCEQRGEEYEELSLMRKTIARRMTESKKTIPHFYLTMPVDMGAVMQFRKKINEGRKDGEKVSVNDIIVKAAALALEQMPQVNASFSEDKIKMNKHINIGVATATPDGLVVPVIPDANKKPIAEIAAETRDKIERAKKRKLRPDEYSNATFTVSNLGMFGIEHFSAIIDPGQSAILAVGAVMKQPVAVDDRVEVKQLMRMTLSCDHRVVDGYTGTQYLVKLRDILEAPDTMK
ncbi:MAG: hypothetical protein Kow0099_33730 [Candidatus Abyssubacteria bacterium]